MSRNLSSQPQDNSTWMVVYVTHDMQDAAIVAGRFKHEGIMATLNHMTEYDAIGIVRGNWGQSAMLVPPKDYVLDCAAKRELYGSPSSWPTSPDFTRR